MFSPLLHNRIMGCCSDNFYIRGHVWIQGNLRLLRFIGGVWFTICGSICLYSLLSGEDKFWSLGYLLIVIPAGVWIVVASCFQENGERLLQERLIREEERQKLQGVNQQEGGEEEEEQ